MPSGPSETSFQSQVKYKGSKEQQVWAILLFSKNIFNGCLVSNPVYRGSPRNVGLREALLTACVSAKRRKQRVCFLSITFSQ